MSATPGPQTATVTPVATSTSPATLFAATGAAANRLIFNDAAAVLYVKFGTAASSTDYTVQVAANGYYELPEPTYSGAVTGTLASGTGTARCTSY